MSQDVTTRFNVSPAAFKASSCFISIPLVTVAWLLVGYTIAFSDDSAGGRVGSLKHIGMLGINPGTARGPVPELLLATFQLGFAIVTAALVSGAIADRAKFAAWMVFVPVWTIAVYAVVAHWVWAPGGWLFELGALDYAGGMVVEIVSGMSALALALVLGPRIGFKKDAAPAQPAFRAARCRPAVVRLVRFQRRFRPGRQWDARFSLPEHAGGRLPRHDGLARGRADPRRQADDLRCRLGSGRRPGRDHPFVRNCEHPWRCGRRAGAGIVCSFAVGAKFRFGYDDSLDVVGVHFVGGVVGVLLIGLLATEVMTGGARGLFYGGGFAQLGKQSLGALVVGAYALAVSYVLAKLIDRFMGFKVSAEDETTGVDFTQHAETAYAEGVHGYQPSRRPTSFGDLGAPGLRPETAEEG